MRGISALILGCGLLPAVWSAAGCGSNQPTGGDADAGWQQPDATAQTDAGSIDGSPQLDASLADAHSEFDASLADAQSEFDASLADAQSEFDASLADAAADALADDCDHTGFTAVMESAMADASAMSYQARSATADPIDVLLIEFYAGFGDPPPLEGPGTYVLATTADEQNYATCGTCVLVRTQCVQSAGCQKTFFASGGTLTLTEYSLGGNLVGTLTDVTLIEVTIDPDTYVSTPVPNGETWCLPSYAFDTPLSG